jgi:hypothetical protein
MSDAPQMVHGTPSSPGSFFLTSRYPRFSGDNTNTTTTVTLPRFSGVIPGLLKITTIKKVQTEQTKVKITSMELYTRCVPLIKVAY